MKFLWPSALFLLVLLPLFVLLYFWMQRRRRRFAVRYSSLSLVRQAVPAQSRIRRYLPLALFLFAFAGLVTGLARPVTVTAVPAGRATVMLVMDVSRSMLQTDISPSRLEAAKEAALQFVQRQQENNQIGIVAFAGFAQLVQPPTTEAEELEAAILSLTTGRGTAIGSGIISALDTIAEYNSDVAPFTHADTNPIEVTPVPEGQIVPDIIVVLTDGVTTTGPDPLDTAQHAADRGVRIYTIGFGTATGSQIPGNDFNRRGFRRGLDDGALRSIADSTGGEYYTATTALELQTVFESLPTYLNMREETIEISVFFAGLAALLVVAAVLLAQLWHPLP